MSERQLVPAGSGTGLRLQRGEQLRVIDPEGGQTGDLVAFSADGRQRQSNGRTFDYYGKIYVSTGDQLWSDRSNPMLTILSDAVGRHDFLYSACNLEMYRDQYGLSGYHPNCHDNLSAALRELGIEPDPLPTPLNVFMHVDVMPDGRLVIVPPKSRAGDAIVLRAEMDLAIALSSCPASTCNGGAPPRPLAFEILEAQTAQHRDDKPPHPHSQKPHSNAHANRRSPPIVKSAHGASARAYRARNTRHARA